MCLTGLGCQETDESLFCQGRCLLTFSPEDGNSSSFRSVVTFSEYLTMGKDQKQAAANCNKLYRLQNRLEVTLQISVYLRRMSYVSLINRKS
jgi:hypothetical protein